MVRFRMKTNDERGWDGQVRWPSLKGEQEVINQRACPGGE